MNSKLAVDVGTGNQWLKSLGLNNLLKFVSDRKMRNRMYYVIELLPNGGYRTLYGSHKFAECKAYVEGQIEQANKIVDIKSANRWLKNIGRSDIYQFEAERPFNGHGKIFCLTKKNERRYAWSRSLIEVVEVVVRETGAKMPACANDRWPAIHSVADANKWLQNTGYYGKYKFGETQDKLGPVYVYRVTDSKGTVDYRTRSLRDCLNHFSDDVGEPARPGIDDTGHWMIYNLDSANEYLRKIGYKNITFIGVGLGKNKKYTWAIELQNGKTGYHRGRYESIGSCVYDFCERNKLPHIPVKY